MRKLMAILLTFGLIMGFAGMASAQDVDCVPCEPPSTIDRGCLAEQANFECDPFDYENAADYCEGKEPRRILFPICDCPEIANLDLAADESVLDIRLEILVNGETGDNGAYWAEDVDGGLQASLYTTESQACADVNNFNTAFVGNFDYRYYTATGTIATLAEGDEPNGLCGTNATIIEPTPGQCLNLDGSTQHGIQLTPANAGQSVIAVNIPEMWFDPTIVQEGDVISVQICITPADSQGCVNTGNLCGQVGCCCTFDIGDLCCPDELQSFNLVYPYATAMNDANWWYGMVITNLTDVAGQATVTVYEMDGDTDSVVVDVPANGMYVNSNSGLMGAFGEGIGDARAYFSVTTDFAASGFFFIGNDGLSEAMGYLPVMQ
jgi:hypothetical protein